MLLEDLSNAGSERKLGSKLDCKGTQGESQMTVEILPTVTGI